MSEKNCIIADMSNPRENRNVCDQMRALRGMQRVEWCRYANRRSDRQNRWYWPCFVKPFAEYLMQQGNTFADASNAAHEILKGRFITTEAFNYDTGERLVYTRSTTDLTTVEFNEYLDKCAAFLGEACGIVVPEPSIYHEPNEEKKREQNAIST